MRAATALIAATSNLLRIPAYDAKHLHHAGISPSARRCMHRLYNSVSRTK